MSPERILGKIKVGAVRKILVETPTVIDSREPIEALLRAMVSDPRTQHVFVVDEGRRLVGSVSLKRIGELLFPFVALLEKPGGVVRQVPFGVRTVGDVMLEDPASVREDTPLSDVASLMLGEDVTELPVTDADGRLIGQVSMAEIVEGFLARLSRRGGEGEGGRAAR